MNASSSLNSFGAKFQTKRSLYVKLKDWMSNSVDPDKTARMSRLIWIYAVCKSLLLSPVAMKELTLYWKTEKWRLFPQNILLRSISDRYWSDRIPFGSKTDRYRFKQNANWVVFHTSIESGVECFPLSALFHLNGPGHSSSQIAMCAKQRLRSTCANLQASFSAWRRFGPLATHRVPCEDSRQTCGRLAPVFSD